MNVGMTSSAALPCAVAWIDSDSSIGGSSSSTQLEFGSISLSSTSGVGVCQVYFVLSRLVHLWVLLAAQDPSLALLNRAAYATVTGAGDSVWVAICVCVDDSGGSSSSSSLTIFDSRTLRIIAQAPLTPAPHAPSSFSCFSLESRGQQPEFEFLHHAREWCSALPSLCCVQHKNLFCRSTPLRF
jgi:hypothetical protein